MKIFLLISSFIFPAISFADVTAVTPATPVVQQKLNVDIDTKNCVGKWVNAYESRSSSTWNCTVWISKLDLPEGGTILPISVTRPTGNSDVVVHAGRDKDDSIRVMIMSEKLKVIDLNQMLAAGLKMSVLYQGPAYKNVQSGN